MVYVSLGTTFHNVPAFYRACFEALGGGPWQVVLSTGGADLDLGAPPENFLVRRFVPQLALLERAGAFVTHGGMNSANEALYFGVPLGGGAAAGRSAHGRRAHRGTRRRPRHLARRDVDAASLRGAVEAVLSNPPFRERAQALGRSLRASGGYRRAADEIQAFARQAGEARGHSGTHSGGNSAWPTR